MDVILVATVAVTRHVPPAAVAALVQVHARQVAIRVTVAVVAA